MESQRTRSRHYRTRLGVALLAMHCGLWIALLLLTARIHRVAGMGQSLALRSQIGTAGLRLCLRRRRIAVVLLPRACVPFVLMRWELALALSRPGVGGLPARGPFATLARFTRLAVTAVSSLTSVFAPFFCAWWVAPAISRFAVVERASLSGTIWLLSLYLYASRLGFAFAFTFAFPFPFALQLTARLADLPVALRAPSGPFGVEFATRRVGIRGHGP